jgi:hypothetical protein
MHILAERENKDHVLYCMPIVRQNVSFLDLYDFHGLLHVDCYFSTCSSVYLLLRSLQKKKTNYMYGFMMKNWLMQSWRLRIPNKCHLQARELGKLEVWVSLSLKAWNLCGGESGSPWCKSHDSEAQEPGTLRPRAGGVECFSSKRLGIFLSVTFLLFVVLFRLDGVYPHWWGCISLIQYTESNANIF